MDKFEIINYIDSELNKNEEDYVFPESYYYCKKRFKNTISKDLEDFVNCNLDDLIVCYNLICIEGDNFNAILKDVETFNKIMSFLDYGSLVRIFNLSQGSNIERIRNIIIDKIKIIESGAKNKNKIQNFMDFFKNASEDLKNFPEKAETYAHGIIFFEYLFNNYKEYLLNLIQIYLSRHVIEIINDEISDIQIKNKYKKRLIKDVYDEHYDELAPGFLALNQISTYIAEEETKKRNYDKNKNRKRRNLKETRKMFLNVCDNEEITNYKDIIKYVEDPVLKEKILTYIYERNCNYIASLDKIINVSLDDKHSKYLVILNRNNVSYDGDLSVFSGLNFNDFEMAVSVLKQMSLDNDVIISILKNTSLSNVLMIRDYFNKGYISYEFINNNIDVFGIGSDKLSCLSNNIMYYQNRDINPYIFRNNSYVFLQDNDLNKRVIDLLEEYNLISSLKNTSDIKFLSDQNIDRKIDYLLELGMEQYLEEDLRLLNYNNYDRIRLLQVLGVTFNSYDEVLKVLDSNSFMIDDESIGDYLPNSNIMMDEVLLDSDLLNNFNNTSRTYKIGNTILSKRKINRLLSEGFSLYTSIFNGNGFTKEEYNSITSSLIK